MHGSRKGQRKDQPSQFLSTTDGQSETTGGGGAAFKNSNVKPIISECPK